MQRRMTGGHRAPGEADGCAEELASLVEHTLLDDLVGLQQERLRDREAEGLRSLEVDEQIKFGRLLDRYVRGPRSAKDPVEIDGHTRPKRGDVRAVRHQSALFDELPEGHHRRKVLHLHRSHNGRKVIEEERTTRRYQSVISL